MGYEIDNTEYAKIITITASDKNPETVKEVNELICNYLDRGWKTFNQTEYVPVIKMSLYWPKYKRFSVLIRAVKRLLEVVECPKLSDCSDIKIHRAVSIQYYEAKKSIADFI